MVTLTILGPSRIKAQLFPYLALEGVGYFSEVPRGKLHSLTFKVGGHWLREHRVAGKWRIRTSFASASAESLGGWQECRNGFIGILIIVLFV